MLRKLIAGNWKMNGLRHSLDEVRSLMQRVGKDPKADILICPPALLLMEMARQTKDSPIMVGGQDCHWRECGAHTGEISAQMLADAGASHVIVGHSERRADCGESSKIVKDKAEAVLAAGLVPIICVGETLEQREAGKAASVVREQVEQSLPAQPKSEIIIAYEPVWAIGTGKVASAGDIAEIHALLREQVGAGIRLLYGGSVKPGNAAEILHIENVDGALVGGASLTAKDFYGIIDNA
jgi:triosephosphate isomerase (TIM)